jgi:mono/diheme cytochrome c family protein
MMRSVVSGAALMAVILTSPGSGGDEAHPMPEEGWMLYEQHCAACHDAGPGHPGTMKLTELGRTHPPLIGRSDLVAAYIRMIVRNGLVEMPPFRPTELTDADLDSLIAYLSSTMTAQSATTSQN